MPTPRGSLALFATIDRSLASAACHHGLMRPAAVRAHRRTRTHVATHEQPWSFSGSVHAHTERSAGVRVPARVVDFSHGFDTSEMTRLRVAGALGRPEPGSVLPCVSALGHGRCNGLTVLQRELADNMSSNAPARPGAVASPRSKSLNASNASEDSPRVRLGGHLSGANSPRRSQLGAAGQSILDSSRDSNRSDDDRLGVEMREMLLESTPTVVLQKHVYVNLGKTKAVSLGGAKSASNKAAIDGIMDSLSTTGARPRFARQEKAPQKLNPRWRKRPNIEVLEVAGHQLLGVPGTSRVRHYGSTKDDVGRKQIVIAMHEVTTHRMILHQPNSRCLPL